MKRNNISTLVTILALIMLLVVCWASAANAEQTTPAYLTRGRCAELIAEYIGNEVSSQKDAIDIVVAYGIMAEYPDGLFHPELTVFRCEFIKLMSHLCDMEWLAPYRADTRFSDVPELHWASGLIRYFDDIGIFADIEVAFEPERPITLAEAKLWLSRLAEAT